MLDLPEPFGPMMQVNLSKGPACRAGQSGSNCLVQVLYQRSQDAKPMMARSSKTLAYARLQKSD